MSLDPAPALCPTCGQHLPDASNPAGRNPKHPAELWPGHAAGLTARESQVVALIARGLDNREIAAELYLGLNTVKTYVRTAYAKMGVDRRSRAVGWAVLHGFTLAGTP